jgi:pimeloyl-ACP methyl ester carboxylesterase
VTLSHRAVHLAGHVPLYYEDIDPGESERPTIVLVHGGGFTGSCYLSTPDGRPGWAHDFVRHGYRVIVPDWPGVGRSGAYPSDDVSGEVIVEALGALLHHLEAQVVLLVHSMSGPYGFRVVEEHGELVRALIAVAPGPPGNTQHAPTILRETDEQVEIASPSMELVIPRRGRWSPTEQFARQKLVGTSKRLSPGLLQALLAATAPIPAGCLLARVNYQSAQLSVSRNDNFAGLPCLVVTGSEDADHSRETDQATVDWLRELGTDVDYHFLSDHGIAGNGHMLMSEDNSGEIADHISNWLTVATSRCRTAAS